jgi:hypothetical protein
MYNMFEITIGSTKINGMYVLIPIVIFVLFGHLICGCSRVSPMEGFSLIKDNLMNSAEYKLNDQSVPNVSSWFDNTKNARKRLDKKQPSQVPLPEGELHMFANTEFKPSCCPNAFSTSQGCACMSMEQLNYLHGRGGNNVPYSEY